MVEVKTVPYLDSFRRFLAKYGDIRYEPVNSFGSERFRIIVSDIECVYEVFDAPDSKRFVICNTSLPDYNDGKPIMLCAVKIGESFVRRDVWDIPFP